MDRARFAQMMGVPEVAQPDGRHMLSRRAAAAAPHVRWNAFIDIISADPATFEAGPRRHAALAFLYESHVQNGGHDAYFAYTGGAIAEETVFALRFLGDDCRAKVLAQAVMASKEGRGERLECLDAQFGRCAPKLVRFLELHLNANEALYIQWDDDV